MSEITPRAAFDKTRFATGIDATAPDTRHVSARMTVEMFEILKTEAIRQDVSMAEVIRQCIELVML